MEESCHKGFFPTRRPGGLHTAGLCLLSGGEATHGAFTTQLPWMPCSALASDERPTMASGSCCQHFHIINTQKGYPRLAPHCVPCLGKGAPREVTRANSWVPGTSGSIESVSSVNLETFDRAGTEPLPTPMDSNRQELVPLEQNRMPLEKLCCLHLQRHVGMWEAVGVGC